MIAEQLAAGTATEEPQNHADATYAPKVEREEGTIDWSQPASRLHNLVRGLQPWPMASTILAGRRCLLHRTTVVPDPCDSGPGTVLAAEGDAIAVAAGDQTAVHILQLQPEAGRAMTAREFLRGRRIVPGTVIQST